LILYPDLASPRVILKLSSGKSHLNDLRAFNSICFLRGRKNISNKRYSVLISIFLKLQIFSAKAVYLWVNTYRYFGVDFYLHLQGSGNLRKDVKGKAVPLQAWTGPESSRKLRFPDFVTTAQNGGKVVNLTHRLPLPPGNTPGTHFC